MRRQKRGGKKKTSVGHSTLYKYLNLRKIGSYPRYDYALEKIDG